VHYCLKKTRSTGADVAEMQPAKYHQPVDPGYFAEQNVYELGQASVSEIPAGF